MKAMLKKFWNDEAGFVVTVEMILVATVLVIGLVTGLGLLRDAVTAELVDTAQAFGSINQSWTVGAMDDQVNHGSAGMSFTDVADGLDATAQADTLVAMGVDVIITPTGNATVGGGNLTEGGGNP